MVRPNQHTALAVQQYDHQQHMGVVENAIGVLEAAAQHALEAGDEASRDAAVIVTLGACGRALGQGQVHMVTPAAKIAARVARLASGLRSLPPLSELTDAIVGWALDPHVPRRVSLALVDALGNFGETPWRAEHEMTVALMSDLDADLRALAYSATDDASAQRAAAVARCLVAVAKNAPFAAARIKQASGGAENIASRCIASLSHARRAVSEVDAWDDLSIDLAYALTRALDVGDCWPLAYCRVANSLVGSALGAASALTTGGPGADRKRASSRLRKYVDKYAKWQHGWLAPPSLSVTDTPLDDVRTEARRSVLVSSLGLQSTAEDEAADVVSLGQQLLSLRRELTAGKSQYDDDEDDHGVSGGSRRRMIRGGGRRGSRAPGGRGSRFFSEADEASLLEARVGLHASLAQLLPGNDDVVSRAANVASNADDLAEYAWLADFYLDQVHSTKLDALLWLVPPEGSGTKCWHNWLGRVERDARTQGSEHPAALNRALSVAAAAATRTSTAEDDVGPVIASLSALLTAGGSMQDAEPSEAARAVEMLAHIATTSASTETALTSASCLARLVDETPASVDACEAALFVARALGGGRELVATRHEARDVARAAERSARALVLAAMRLGRAVPSSKSGSVVAKCLVGVLGKHGRTKFSASGSTRRSSRAANEEPEPWPLDTPLWTESSSHPTTLASQSSEDDAALLLESLLSSEAVKKVVTEGAHEAKQKERSTTPPPQEPSDSVPQTPPSELTVVVPTSQPRGKKAHEAGKKMLMLRREHIEPELPPVPAASQAPVPAAAPEKKRRDTMARAAPAEACARAVARWAVGAKLKTRLGGAAATLGTLREEVISPRNGGSVATVALIAAFEQEMAVASELLPRTTTTPTDTDRVAAFGDVVLKPALPIAAFFRQNRAVCDEWLSSIRLAAAELATRHRVYADAIYQSDAAVQRKGIDDSTWRRAFTVGILARVALGDEFGLRASIRAVADDSRADHARWLLEAAADVAAGHYEPALRALLDSAFQLRDPEALKLSIELLARCLAAVGDEQTEAGVAQRLVAWRQSADDEALQSALAPRRSALALDRWACPPDDDAECLKHRRYWSRLASFDVDAALEGRNLDDDVLRLVVLPPSAAHEDRSLFDATRKLRVSPRLDLSRIEDIGRLSAIVDRELPWDNSQPAAVARRADLSAMVAVTARKARCPATAARALDAMLTASADADATRRKAAPIFAALERHRLFADGDEFLVAALDAADASFFLKDETCDEITTAMTPSLLLATPAEWLAETLDEIAKALGSVVGIDQIARRVKEHLHTLWSNSTLPLRLKVKAAADAGGLSLIGACLDAAAALSPTKAVRWMALGEWHELRHDCSAAKHAYARALSGGVESSALTHLCATRAMRLISYSPKGQSEDEGRDNDDGEADSAELWNETPVSAWARLSPQLLAECYGVSRFSMDRVQESVAFNLLRRVALASPRVVLHAVVVGVREGCRGRQKSQQQQLLQGHGQGDECRAPHQLSAAAASAPLADVGNASDGQGAVHGDGAAPSGQQNDHREDSDDEYDVVDDDDDEDVAAGNHDHDSEDVKKKLLVVSQKKRRAAAFLGSSDDWAKGAVHMRALRAELALSGEETRKLLRGTELLVDELKSIARLPDDRWRIALQSSSLTRVGDLAHVRGLAGYFDIAADASEAGDAKATESLVSDNAAREIAAFKSRAIAAPARRHLERAARELLVPPTDMPVSCRSYDRAFSARVRPLVDAAINEFVAVDSCSRRKKRGANYDRKFDEAWHRAIESLRVLREGVVAGDWIGSELSPALAMLPEEANDVWIPVVRSGDSFCRIKKINDRVSALSSKTRPKKLSFACEDANRTFLLKGAEDVHLDQRIMQLLDVVNDILRRDATSRHRPPLVATYSVLPLSRSSGLIEWVPRTRTLFALYNAEMTSKLLTSAIAERQKLAKGGGDAQQQPVVLDPALIAAETEKYALRYDALPRAFHLEIEKRDVSLARQPRSSWPLEALRAVHDTLAAEAPHRLVERELWRGSRDAANWLCRRRNYAAKLGASCVSAFSLGLGDRHLENVLYDEEDGSIVDVDWGVCFDAGTRLRVPERVPFRLTPVVIAPLERGGLRDGDFVRSASALLAALRRGERGGDAFIALLEVCCRDARVEWRATLGGMRQHQHDDRQQRAAKGQSAAAVTAASMAANEKKAAALALAAARCLGSSILPKAAEARGARLREVLMILDALADAPPTSQSPPPTSEDAVLTLAADQKRAELKILKVRKEAAANERINATAKVAFELERESRRRADRNEALRRLLVASGVDAVVNELRSRARALTAQTALLDLAALRESQTMLLQGARLAQFAVRELRRLMQQDRQRRLVEHEQTADGSLFSTDLFGGGAQSRGASSASPWGDRGETAAERLRRKQATVSVDSHQRPPAQLENEETRLVASLAAEIEADCALPLDTRFPRALLDLANSVEAYAPFVRVDVGGDESGGVVDDDEVYRVERAAAVAKQRRRRVLACLDKIDACRPRAAATLSACRGHARRAVRTSTPSIAAVDVLASDLANSTALDVTVVPGRRDKLDATSLTYSKKLVSRLLFLEQQRVATEASEPQQQHTLQGGAIGEALWCLGLVFDADLADAAMGEEGVVHRTVNRLEAIRDLTAGLGVVVEAAGSAARVSAFPPLAGSRDEWTVAKLKTGLKSMAHCAEAASKMARDASRLFATSLFDRPTDAASTEWRALVVRRNLNRNWQELVESSAVTSPSDATVLRAIDTLLAPVEEHLARAEGELSPLLGTHERNLSASFADAKFDTALAVLGARHDALTANAQSGRRLEVLAHGDQAERRCAEAVSTTLRSVCGQPMERLVSAAIARVRSFISQLPHSLYEDDGHDRATLGCLSLAAAAQVAARLERADDRDAVTRLHHHLSRRERRTADAAAALACDSSVTLESRNHSEGAKAAHVTFDDEELLLAARHSETAERRAALVRLGAARCEEAARNRAAIKASLTKAAASVEIVGTAISAVFDRLAARRAAITAVLARIGAARASAVGGDNYVVWLRNADALDAAANLVIEWLADVRLTASAATSAESNEQTTNIVELRAATDRAEAAEAAVAALYDVKALDVQKAEAALAEMRDARLRVDRARDAARDAPAIFAALLEGYSRVELEPAKHKSSVTALPWTELAASCRELASLAVSRRSTAAAAAEERPPGLLRPPSRGHNAIDVPLAARRLARRFEDVQSLDNTLCELVDKSEPLQALCRAADSDRAFIPGARNKLLDDVSKFARKARKTDYCILLQQQQHEAAANATHIALEPPFRRSTVSHLLADEHRYPNSLILTFFAVSRAACRNASDVLEFADLENVPRIDSAGVATSILDEDDGDDDVEPATERNPSEHRSRPDHARLPSPPSAGKSLTSFGRAEAAHKALAAATQRLDGAVQGRVEDQLARLIRVATDPDVLCQMYEGWAPWI